MVLISMDSGLGQVGLSSSAVAFGDMNLEKWLHISKLFVDYLVFSRLS